MTPSTKPPEPALAIPVRYDSVTMICRCGNEFSPSGRRRYCSDACKQKAWRSRHAAPPIPRRVAPADTVYSLRRMRNSLPGRTTLSRLQPLHPKPGPWDNLPALR